MTTTDFGGQNIKRKNYDTWHIRGRDYNKYCLSYRSYKGLLNLDIPILVYLKKMYALGTITKTIRFISHNLQSLNSQITLGLCQK